MKSSYLFTTALFLISSTYAVYPPPAGIDSSDPDLVTIQNDILAGESSGKGLALADIPEDLQNAPASTPSNSEADSDLSLLKSAIGSATEPDTEVDDGEKSSTNAFFLSTSMIVVSEIGDKTFLVAALMAMKHDRLIVFSSAFSALVLMTILSGVAGHALPALLDHRVTQFLAAVLFVVFGINLLREGLAMSKDAGVEDELAEVQEEIEIGSINNNMNSVEHGTSPAMNRKPVWKESLERVKDLASFILSPVWVQTFAMTFLGEWGDRSQIATIAMAAGSDYWLVILGGIVGHFLCTGLAVIGGHVLATKISMRTVTLGGSAAFFIFAVLYFYQAYYDIE